MADSDTTNSRLRTASDRPVGEHVAPSATEGGSGHYKTALPMPRVDDPEGILLYGIERIAEKRRPEKGGGFIIMDAVGANEFAGEILTAYLRARAGVCRS